MITLRKPACAAALAVDVVVEGTPALPAPRLARGEIGKALGGALGGMAVVLPYSSTTAGPAASGGMDYRNITASGAEQPMGGIFGTGGQVPDHAVFYILVADVSATVDPRNGFPSWYQDANGVRVQPCFDPNDVNCVAPISATYAAPTAAIQPSLGRPLAGGTRTVSLALIEPFTMFEGRITQLDVRLLAGILELDGRPQRGVDVGKRGLGTVKHGAVLWG